MDVSIELKSADLRVRVLLVRFCLLFMRSKILINFTLKLDLTWYYLIFTLFLAIFFLTFSHKRYPKPTLWRGKNLLRIYPFCVLYMWHPSLVRGQIHIFVGCIATWVQPFVIDM